MLTFPFLSTDAVAQYPLPLSYTSPVEVIRFIDGADQRFPRRASILRSWHVQLSLINDSETYQIEQFFEALAGQYSAFMFPDPYSGEIIPNCRLGDSSLVTDYLATDLSSTSLWVVETHG